MPLPPSVLPIQAEFSSTSTIQVAVFMIECGVAVHVAGDGPTSADAVTRAVSAHMASRDGDILAVPVLGPGGLVAVLTAHDPLRDPALARQLQEMGQIVISRTTSPIESDRLGPDESTDPQLRPLLDSAGTAVVVVDAHGEVVWANRQAEAVGGARLDDLIGRRAWTPTSPATETSPPPVETEDNSDSFAVPASPVGFRRPPAGKPLSILVAEDNPVNQKVTTALIQRLGHKISIAPDGVDVLDALDRDTFDLVFLDLRMPRLSGLETAAQIVARFGSSRPPVIALTASATAGDRERCLESGMDAFVTKPITLDGLRNVIDSTVAGREISDLPDLLHPVALNRSPV